MHSCTPIVNMRDGDMRQGSIHGKNQKTIIGELGSICQVHFAAGEIRWGRKEKLWWFRVNWASISSKPDQIYPPSPYLQHFVILCWKACSYDSVESERCSINKCRLNNFDVRIPEKLWWWQKKEALATFPQYKVAFWNMNTGLKVLI